MPRMPPPPPPSPPSSPDWGRSHCISSPCPLSPKPPPEGKASSFPSSDSKPLGGPPWLSGVCHVEGPAWGAEARGAHVECRTHCHGPRGKSSNHEECIRPAAIVVTKMVTISLIDQFGQCAVASQGMWVLFHNCIL